MVSGYCYESKRIQHGGDGGEKHGKLSGRISSR